jgi:hypothetical protein
MREGSQVLSGTRRPRATQQVAGTLDCYVRIGADVNIEIVWSQPIQLRSGKRQNLIYIVPDLEAFPVSPGVYVLGRFQPGVGMVPVCIGKAKRLRRRIRQQLNNARLMLGLRNAPRVRRFLALGEYIGRPGPQARKAIRIVERSLIEYALAEGYELLNQQGTHRPHHSIRHGGGRRARIWLPAEMAAPKR